jgi:hypothetical protein
MGLCPSRALPAPVVRSAQELAQRALRARHRWKRAVARIVHILRIRQRWALVGQALQEERLQSLCEGLVRVKGILHRPRGGRRFSR